MILNPILMLLISGPTRSHLAAQPQHTINTALRRLQTDSALINLDQLLYLHIQIASNQPTLLQLRIHILIYIEQTIHLSLQLCQ